MSKQEKVINKINYCSGQTTPLGTKPNDECYTSMQDIINELAHWREKFAGKNIICPCDWDILDDSDSEKNVYSLKIDFTEEGILGHINTVKSIQYTLFDFDNGERKINKIVRVTKNEIEYFLKERVKCNFIRTFVEKAEEWRIKSITASGYNPANGKGIPFQNVDFSDYDICVTNPPFSLYREFLNLK